MHRFEVGGLQSTRGRMPADLRQWEVRGSDGPGGRAPVVATRVELGRGLAPVVWMYGAADGEPLGCVRPLVKSVDDPAETFEVYAADGGQLAVIGYACWRLWPWPRRNRWSLRPADGGDIVGGVGTWYAWTLAICLFPVWWLLMLLGLILAWLDWDFIGWQNVADAPSRIRWFQRGRRGWVMDRSADGSYRLRTERLDYRVAYALGLASAWNEVARKRRR